MMRLSRQKIALGICAVIPPVLAFALMRWFSVVDVAAFLMRTFSFPVVKWLGCVFALAVVSYIYTTAHGTKASPVMRNMAVVIMAIIWVGLGVPVCWRIANWGTFTDYSENTKVADLAEGASAAGTLTWPSGRSYNIAVGLASHRKERSDNDSGCVPLTFKGEIHIADESGTVKVLPFSSRNAAYTTLRPDAYGWIGAFCLTSQESNLDRLVSGRKYYVEIVFDRKPQELTSLWLTYLHSAYDEALDKRNTLRVEQGELRDRMGTRVR